MTIGRNLLDYGGNTKAPAVDLIAMKLLLNSVLGAPGAKFMTIDIKNSTQKQRSKISNI